MNKCGDCYQYKNGCNFSESKLPEEILSNYAACMQFLTKEEFDDAMEKAYEVVKHDIR